MEYYETLNQTERARLVSATKRLNERMRDMERKGLTETKSYQRLMEFVANTPNAKDKRGHLRAKQTYKLTAQQAKRALKLGGNKNITAGGEMARAKKYLQNQIEAPTREQIIKQANDYGQTESYIRENLSKLYDQTAIKDKPLTKTEKEDFIGIMKDEMLTMDERREHFNNWLESVKR